MVVNRYVVILFIQEEHVQEAEVSALNFNDMFPTSILFSNLILQLLNLLILELNTRFLCIQIFCKHSYTISIVGHRLIMRDLEKVSHPLFVSEISKLRWDFFSIDLLEMVYKFSVRCSCSIIMETLCFTTK
jgi:hypothetical protein